VTPLWAGHATPFLRWNSGDLVSFHSHGESPGEFARLFPMIRHAHRTTGFFKIRGVNVNHTEFEDFMFGNPRVNDFQGVLASRRAPIGWRTAESATTRPTARARSARRRGTRS